jgi:hypothetical protein
LGIRAPVEEAPPMNETNESSKYSLPLICSKCKGGPVRAIRSKDRVLIRCENCGSRAFAYYLDPKRQEQGDLPPEREDQFVTQLVVRDLLKRVSPPTRALYEFLVRFVRENGFSPTSGEIQLAIGWDSRSTVLYHLKQLEQVGLIERSFAVQRGIRIIHAA